MAIIVLWILIGITSFTILGIILCVFAGAFGKKINADYVIALAFFAIIGIFITANVLRALKVF
jgi:hypothetical protein